MHSRVSPSVHAAVAIAIVILLEAPASADTDHVFQSWSAGSVRADLDRRAPGLTLWLDAQVRRGSQHIQALFRPAVAYRFDDWGSVWLGYLFVPTFHEGSAPDRHEHRTWQDFRGSWRLGRWKLSFRTRLEQRFLEGHHDVGWRGRQRVQARFRLGPQSAFWLVAHDEVFVGANDTDWNVRTGLDQNRVFAGLGVTPSERVGVQVGYLHQYLHRQPPRMAHVLFGSVGFVWRAR